MCKNVCILQYYVQVDSIHRTDYSTNYTYHVEEGMMGCKKGNAALTFPNPFTNINTLMCGTKQAGTFQYSCPRKTKSHPPFHRTQTAATNTYAKEKRKTVKGNGDVTVLKTKAL